MVCVWGGLGFGEVGEILHRREWSEEVMIVIWGQQKEPSSEPWRVAHYTPSPPIVQIANVVREQCGIRAPRVVDEIGELISPSGDDVLSSRNLEPDTYPLLCS